MPTASATSAREILTGLHDVMASRSSAQAKLNKVVHIIAEAMASEVCSIYLLRDGVLELFATVGLNQKAVHVTKLAMGEGLVGTIAQQVAVLNLDEASRHPEFAYRPETGAALICQNSTGTPEGTLIRIRRPSGNARAPGRAPIALATDPRSSAEKISDTAADPGWARARTSGSSGSFSWSMKAKVPSRWPIGSEGG
jgi:hypothetical protein